MTSFYDLEQKLVITIFWFLWITWDVVVEFVLLASDLHDQCLIHWATELNLGGKIWFRYLVNELISLFIIYLYSYDISFYGFINPTGSLKHLYNSLNYEQQWTQYTTSPDCIQPIKPYLSGFKVNKTHKLETEIYDTNKM